jgi:hypothetical protein
MSIIDVIGIYILKLGLSTTISPGSFPNGNFEIHGQRKPTIRMAMPIKIKIF